jgi:hypothetical protein
MTSAAADLSERLAGGKGLFVGIVHAPELPEGWVEDERVAAGTATSYRAVGDLGGDGRYELAETTSAEYRTRIVIRRPPPDQFNGTVVMEWFNVSGGADAAPDYTFLATELFRSGYAWVGVSAQLIGVEGGPVALGVEGGDGTAGVGVRHLDPARYGTLTHPGDAFSYDIYTQVARALRHGAALGDLVPERILGLGESQSAFALVTYANGVQPRTQAFDGFLIHSRAAVAFPLGEPGGSIDIIGSIGGVPTRIRDDLDVPVIVVESETDVLLMNYQAARQDDTDRFRLWEIAGTSHADRFLIGERANALDCGCDINDGPQRFVVRAALHALDNWMRSGAPPSPADRLALDERPAFVRDDDGIVLGGIRTPQVDTPVDVLSGEPGPSAAMACMMLGSTRPLPPSRLLERYGTAEAYLEAFEAATDAAIDSGFVLAGDRESVLADARPERLSR